MLVNFLHPFFKSRVDCDVVSSDGYSVGNLVSVDFRESSRGFLAAHFVKPPALLLFQLPFPVHVESMIIKPKVGSQISSGIAILVAGIATKRDPSGKGDTSNNKSTQLSKKKRSEKELLSDSNKVGFIGQQDSAVCCQNRLEKEASIHIPNHSYELDITPGSVKGEHSQFFSQVAWLNDREGKTIHIQNKLFQQRSPVQGPVGRSGFQEGEFQRPYLLQKVTHVALKIVRPSGSSVPAIGKVEIWGQPSAVCRPGVLEYALGIQEQIQTGAVIKTTTAIRNRITENSKNHTLLSHSCSTSLPEDFIDPITCELMTVPVLLPSGHNVDTITLEKHITAERLWGRLPSDPFTGKVFSDTSKPVPNSALKVRIDKFLLTSGVSTSSHGRTVGRENSISRASKLNSSLLLKPNSDEPSGESNKTFHCGSKEFSEQSDSNSREDVSDQMGVQLGHEEAVSRSLDSAVHQTLRGLHMFTRNITGNNRPTLMQSSIAQANTVGLQGRLKRAAPQASETLRNQIKRKKSTVLCVTCDRDLSTESIFHLPCQHLMCRSCLMSATKERNSGSTCKLCKTKFRQKDVTRVHNM